MYSRAGGFKLSNPPENLAKVVMNGIEIFIILLYAFGVALCRLPFVHGV